MRVALQGLCAVADACFSSHDHREEEPWNAFTGHASIFDQIQEEVRAFIFDDLHIREVGHAFIRDASIHEADHASILVDGHAFVREAVHASIFVQKEVCDVNQILEEPYDAAAIDRIPGELYDAVVVDEIQAEEPISDADQNAFVSLQDEVIHTQSHEEDHEFTSAATLA